METELDPNQEEEEDNEEEHEEGQEVQMEKDDLYFDEMIASRHIRLKVPASW